MAKPSPVAQAVLWLFVLSAGILTGGSIFEHTVLTPLWAGSPPESVTQWQYGGIQGKFFRIATPIYALTALVLGEENGRGQFTAANRLRESVILDISL